MAVTIVLSSQKGGVGKATSIYVLATSLKGKGYKVLAVGMDSQGDLSLTMGVGVEGATIYDVLRGELKPRYAVRGSALVDTIPTNILLSSIESEFTGQHRESLLKETPDSLKNLYDYILIGSPPALRILTVNTFTAADYVLVPILSDIFSFWGVTQLEEIIRRVRDYCNSGIQTLGVFLTEYNPRIRFSKEVKGTLRMVANGLRTPVLDTFIRKSIALREARLLQCSVSDYVPGCSAVQNYENLPQELVRRGLKMDG